jgi:hypothetical protein
MFFFAVTATHAKSEETRSITGKVFLKGEKKPLSGITVYVEDNDELSSITGDDGSFTLNLPVDGEYKISAFGMGYEKPEPLKVTIDENNKSVGVKIYLLPVTTTLNEIVVTADRSPDRVSKIVITGKVLEQVPGTGGDPLKAIIKLPGVTTAASTGVDGAGGFGPAIRGSSPEDNRYYIDDLPAVYLFHMGGLISVVNADLVDDFNLYAAAYGPEYGDGLGGIIDVKLREPRTDRMGYKLNMGIFESDFLVEGPVKEGQSFYFAARRSYIDLVLPKTGELAEGLDYTIFPNFYDYQGKYIWDMNDTHKLIFQALGSSDEIGMYIKEGSDAAKLEPIIQGALTSESSFHATSVTLRSRLSPVMNNKFIFGYYHNYFATKAEGMGNVEGTGDGVLFRNHLNWHAAENHDLLLGIEGAYGITDLNLDMNFTFPNDFDPNVDMTGATRKTLIDKFASWGQTSFVKDRWKIADKTILSLGLRQTYDEWQNATNIDPRLGLEYDLNETTLITAGWGKYHQQPDGQFIVEEWGNPDLKYMTSYHYVVGAEKKIGDGYKAKAEVYYKEIIDLIIPDTEKNYVHGGSGTASGLELLLQKRETTNWYGWASVSYSESVRKNNVTGETLPFKADQPYVINLVYSRKLSNAWTVGGAWRYQTGSPYTPVIDTKVVDAGTDYERTRPIYGDINSERLPEFHQLDIRIDRDWIYDDWKLGMYWDIYNVYFRDNITGYAYNPDYSEKTGVPAVTMPLSFGVKAEF